MCVPPVKRQEGGESRTIFASLYLPRYSFFFAAATFAFPNEEEHFAFSLSPFCFRRICPTFCVCPPPLPPPRQLKSTKKSIGDLSFFFSLFFSGKWRKTGEKICHQKQLETKAVIAASGQKSRELHASKKNKKGRVLCTLNFAVTS